MQHTNDDIDDLLRNAADSYPLKITGANWEGIAGRLSDEEGEGEPAVVVPIENAAKRYRRYLLAMLLIPVSLILAKYAGLIGNGDSQRLTQPQTEKTVKVEPKPETKPATVDNADLNKAAVVEPKESGVSSAAQKAFADVANKNDNGGSKFLANKKSSQFSMNVANAGVVGDNVTGENKNQSNVPHLSDLPALQQNQEIVAASRNSNGNVTISDHPATQVNDEIAGTTPSKVKENAATPSAPVAEQAQPQGKTPSPLVHHNTRKGRFYIGAFVAPDYTTVKYQPGSKVGFNSGGVIGYTFMKNLSVEVGIAAGRKYYTSSGKYFNSTESWLSSWGKVLNISGYASLTEFPINFKYDFKPSKDGNFFVAAGVVSYIVHQENYDYELDKNGVIYTRDKSPIVATNNLFANASISGGYESSLGGLCNFRIEPYYRIPIKGIGIGGLPITSIGLNIGITKKFK